MKKLTLSVFSLFALCVLSSCAQIPLQQTPEYVFNGTQGCRINQSGYFIPRYKDGCKTYFNAWDRGGYAHARALLMHDAQKHHSDLAEEFSEVRAADPVRYSDRDLLPQQSRSQASSVNRRVIVDDSGQRSGGGILCGLRSNCID